MQGCFEQPPTSEKANPWILMEIFVCSVGLYTHLKLPECQCSNSTSTWMNYHHQHQLQRVIPPGVRVDYQRKTSTTIHVYTYKDVKGNRFTDNLRHEYFVQWHFLWTEVQVLYRKCMYVRTYTQIQCHNVAQWHTVAGRTRSHSVWITFGIPWELSAVPPCPREPPSACSPVDIDNEYLYIRQARTYAQESVKCPWNVEVRRMDF